MQKRQAGLGPLGTKFFALVQMKGKEIVRLGEIYPYLRISPDQEKRLLQRLTDNGYIVRLMKGAYLVPKKIPPGGHWSPNEYYLINEYMNLINGKYYIGGPIAFHYYGFVKQIPNVITVYNDKISCNKKIANIMYQFIKVSSNRLGDLASIDLEEGEQAIIASLERTLVDAMHDWHRFNTIPKVFSWVESYLKTNSAEGLVQTTLTFSNVATCRRLGYVLERLNTNEKLLEALYNTLRPTQSWTQLDPKQARKGKTNSKWRIINNVYTDSASS